MKVSFWIVDTTFQRRYRTEHSKADIDKIDAACHEGGTSFHAGGVNPGFAGDLLVLTLARFVSQIDTIHIYEVVNFGRDTKYLYDSMPLSRK